MIALLAITLSLAQSSTSRPADFAGQYALQIAGQNFVALDLRLEQDALTGTVWRPGNVYPGGKPLTIRADVLTESVLAIRDQQGFHLAPKDRAPDSPRTEFDLRLLSPRQVSLKVSGTANAWILSRLPGLPSRQIATDWELRPNEDVQSPDDAELQKIVDADQKPRVPGQSAPLNPAELRRQDAERRDRVRSLLAEGSLHTAMDYQRAALVFQHGSVPDDYLLAHTLAVAAVAKGAGNAAVWLASATLDRYLNSIRQPQIYGTQFHSGSDGWTQEPYNRVIVSDPLRMELKVPTLEDQTRQLERYRKSEQH